jgi:FKBP-type peptidyl-prolyl cis-trans isomerase FklB
MKIPACVVLGLSLVSAATFAATATTTTSTTGGQTSTMTSSSFMQGADVVTLPDGLKYKIIKAGQGPKPTLNSTVVVNYEGTLTNGSKFDSSYDRGEPATFQVGQVIPGWVEVLQLMPVGSTWEVYIPANLAYGEAGAPPVIGPNEPLIFKVELLDIKK